MGRLLIFLILAINPIYIKQIDSKELTINAQKNHNEEAMKKAWVEFVKSTSPLDCKKLFKLSARFIHCPYCLSNTKQESDLLAHWKNSNKNWYEEYYRKHSSLRENKFCSEDLSIILTDHIKKNISNNKFIIYKNDKNNFEILVTDVAPGELHTDHEGLQISFGFTFTEIGYLFERFSTIP